MSFKGIWNTIVEIFKAILKGEFLTRLHFDKYFMHIIYTFVLAWLSIVISMQIEETMVKVEENKAVLNELKIYHAQKKVELSSIDRISTLEQLLRENGSEMTLPERPASIIKDK